MKLDEVPKLLAAHIRDRRDEPLGVIRELLVNMASGQIEGVVVQAQNQHVTIPWESLEFDDDEQVLRVVTAEEALLPRKGNSLH